MIGWVPSALKVLVSSDEINLRVGPMMTSASGRVMSEVGRGEAEVSGVVKVRRSSTPIPITAEPAS